MFNATDTYEYFDPELGFLRSIDGDEWFVVPLRIYTNGKRLKEIFNTKEAAAKALIEYVKSQPRPKKNKFEFWPGTGKYIDANVALKKKKKA